MENRGDQFQRETQNTSKELGRVERELQLSEGGPIACTEKKLCLLITTIDNYSGKIKLLEADSTIVKREIQAYRQEIRLHRRDTQQVHKELNVLRDEVR